MVKTNEVICTYIDDLCASFQTKKARHLQYSPEKKFRKYSKVALHQDHDLAHFHTLFGGEI